MRLFAILLAAILLSSAIGCKTCDSCTPAAAPIAADQNDFQSWTVDPKVHTNKIDEVIR